MFIVYDVDNKDKTIEFYKYDVDALHYKGTLEDQGLEVEYHEVPNCRVAHAKAVYFATR